MNSTNDGHLIIEPLDADQTGIHIRDPIEVAQFKLFTPEAVDPAPTDPSGFFFPVDEAVEFETDRVIVPKLLTLHIREGDGEFRATFDPSQGSETVECGPRIVQLSTAPMTLYLETTSEMTIRRDDQSVVLSFEEPAPVRLGARSFHESPTETIQVTDDPGDVMKAISYFGSALQTLSPERSFGTLRGHPPALECGSSLEIPDSLDRPESPVTIEIPPAFEYVYPAAPLAFYLGASVEPGPEPRLQCGEVDRSLDGPDGYQATVHDLLQHVFFMDCITRTEGFYRIDLHEREQLEHRLDESIDFAELYDASLAEQLQRYLELPQETVELIRPTWHLTTDVEASADSIESLPFIVHELPLVRCPYTPTAPPKARAPAEPVESPEKLDAKGRINSFVRRPDWDASPGPSIPPLPENVFKAPDAPTVEHEWLGPGIPLMTNKATAETFRRRHTREPVDADHISIDIVCNDPAMNAERVVEDCYGLRDLVQFDITVHEHLACADLAEVLAEPTDLLHYIGHVDEQGFRCTDGFLDAETLENVGCRAFLLNACTSYNQGQALIDAGSYGGVVTISEVANSVATETGHTIARLLNSGFTLRSAMSITHEHHAIGQQYIVVGDGGIQLVQSESAVPTKIDLRHKPESEDEFEFDFYAYPSSSAHTPGTFGTIHINDFEANYLPFDCIGTFQVNEEELLSFLELEHVPIEFDGRLIWADELELTELGSSGVTTISGDSGPGLR